MDNAHANTSSWHPGETSIQSKLGVAEQMDAVGKRVIRDYMPEQHRHFYEQLPFVVVGSVDPQGEVWATLLTGAPGFMSSPTPSLLEIAAYGDVSDPASVGLRKGCAVGLLGLERHTRRRNRMNGRIVDDDHVLRVAVDQSFGNCPRYIQLHDAEWARPPDAPFEGVVERLAGLDSHAVSLIRSADTFFVASYADRVSGREVDVSHRGGKPGFVRIDDDGLMTIPDFNGNLFFSTLGNFALNGKAGLLFVDDGSGDMLQISGHAELVFDSPDIEDFKGAERLWTFRAKHIVRRRAALPLRWQARSDGQADSTAETGDWSEVLANTRAAQRATRWQPFTVTRIVDESTSVKSFYLAPADGTSMPLHKAGQHLSIRLKSAGSDTPLIRTYTLSSAPADGIYRISVKRDGVFSQALHDHVRVGDLIDARPPAGTFTMDAPTQRPVVLLTAGIGLTPMLAMLRHLVSVLGRDVPLRPMTLFHASRTVAERPFDREIADLVAASAGTVKHIRVVSDAANADAGRDYDVAGRIDMALLTRYLAFDDYSFYVCGPPAFMQAMYDGLRGYGVADARIHAEAFGPSSLTRSSDSAAPASIPRPPATRAVPVVFTESLKEARWAPDDGSLLALAERRGLAPPFSCRVGSCGTCRTKLLKGAVTYLRPPAAAFADDEVLICCAVPAEADVGEDAAVHLAL